MCDICRAPVELSELSCCSFQPGHSKCPAEERRSGQPVWIFCCLPPAAGPRQKEPVSERSWLVTHLLLYQVWTSWFFFFRLLVGAPRGKHQNHVNVTGVVYQCDLTTASERCQPIQFDHEGWLTSVYMDACITCRQHEYILDDLSLCFIKTEFSDSKGINNQWMGVRVASQGPGKNIMVSNGLNKQK